MSITMKLSDELATVEAENRALLIRTALQAVEPSSISRTPRWRAWAP
jgi:hypothetical protein